MKKLVFKVDLKGERDKIKVLKAVSSLNGVDSIAMDTKDNKLTVIGNVDPVDVLSKLRKCWYVELISVGPAKEPEKKEEEAKKGEEEKNKENEQVAELVKAFQAYKPLSTSYYYAPSAEGDPKACAIV